MDVADQREGRPVDKVAYAQQAMKYPEVSTYVVVAIGDSHQILTLLCLPRA